MLRRPTSLIVFVSILAGMAASACTANPISGAGTTPIAVHACAKDGSIGEIPVPHASAPSTVMGVRSVAFPRGEAWLYSAAIDEPTLTSHHVAVYIFPGVVNGSCTASYGADGSLEIETVNKAGAVTDEYDPAAPGMLYPSACTAFPELAQVINDSSPIGCSAQSTYALHPLASGIAVPGLLIGISGTFPGQGNRGNFIQSNPKYVIWRIAIADTKVTAGSGSPNIELSYRSISCAESGANIAMCPASFDSFLTQSAGEFGLGHPSLSRAYAEIRNYITNCCNAFPPPVRLSICGPPQMRPPSFVFGCGGAIEIYDLRWSAWTAAGPMNSLGTYIGHAAAVGVLRWTSCRNDGRFTRYRVRLEVNDPERTSHGWIWADMVVRFGAEHPPRVTQLRLTGLPDFNSNTCLMTEG